jgi:universal stress protein A
MTRLFRKMVVPHDFSPHATAALRAAVELAAEAKGRLVVLHAIPPTQLVVGMPPVAPAEWLPPPVPTVEMVAEERRRLEAIVRKTIGRRRVRAECRVVVADPFQAILDAARGATAIVMGTLGRTGLPHLVLGSVAEKVVRHAAVPVLTIRARARGGRRRARR